MDAERVEGPVSAKAPCLYPLPDGRRCCECDTYKQAVLRFLRDRGIDTEGDGMSTSDPHSSSAATPSLRYVRSNMGLVHVVASPGLAICGTAIRASWAETEVENWPRQPDVCRLCDDVMMGRGRKAAS
jgi:hypothetical protein